jgi:hypothetical protein
MFLFLVHFTFTFGLLFGRQSLSINILSAPQKEENYFLIQMLSRFSALANALQKFKNPDTPEDPEKAFQPFKDIFKTLAPYTKPSTLKLSDISPELAKIKSSVIPVPGIHLQVI